MLRHALVSQSEAETALVDISDMQDRTPNIKVKQRDMCTHSCTSLRPSQLVRMEMKLNLKPHVTYMEQRISRP